ncbi:MAG: hypothetical protein NTZ16_12255 [Verrucomicrobia bacterium]|nr:hypothetical protein [Verrucomicrobiota bacterium]
MKTDQTTTKYKRYAAAFKHSAVESWMLSGKSVRIIASAHPGQVAHCQILTPDFQVRAEAVIR